VIDDGVAGSSYHPAKHHVDVIIVTASITEEIKRERNNSKEEPNQDEELNQDKKSNQGKESDPVRTRTTRTELAQRLSQKGMTREEQNTGIGSVSQTGSADLMGKLCRCVMVLIWWKVGANVAVMEHVVWALEEWLHRRGISIYTDLL
jgi:hypothetical protein